jgi:hypothetical protein
MPETLHRLLNASALLGRMENILYYFHNSYLLFIAVTTFGRLIREK